MYVRWLLYMAYLYLTETHVTSGIIEFCDYGSFVEPLKRKIGLYELYHWTFVARYLGENCGNMDL